MKKVVMVLIVASMILGLILTGCSSIKEEVKDTLKEEGVDLDTIEKDIIEIKDDLTEESIDENTVDDAAETKVEESIWGEIAKYKVETILEEKPNEEVYILAYISKDKTSDIVDYFDALLKDTEGYDCKKITEKESVINGYLKGYLEGRSIIVAVDYDNVNDENRVEFTSY
jgi:flagellar motor switch protein FliG